METLLPPGRSSVVNGHLWSFLQKVLFLSSSSCGDKMMDSPKERFNPGYVLHYSPPPPSRPSTNAAAKVMKNFRFKQAERPLKSSSSINQKERQEEVEMLGSVLS